MSVFYSYKKILEKYDIADHKEINNLMGIIKEGLRDFVSLHKCTAIYCYGSHTERLMADFMFSLKDVRYIIDNFYEGEKPNGFRIIHESDIEQEGIDGVILSSFKFHIGIGKGMCERHENIAVFDLYDYLKEHGIDLGCEYYRWNHPYHHYHRINALQRKIRNCFQTDVDVYKELISEFIYIKDFRLASETAFQLFETSNNPKAKELGNDLKDLYEKEIEDLSHLSKDHVIMICVDGLRRKSFSVSSMPKTYHVLKKKAENFTNAYSYSTSTFESLIPSYSENFDTKTQCYQRDYVQGENCRFIRKAKEQRRKIHFYTHMDKMVEDQNIDHVLSSCTVTQLIWNFLKDGTKEKFGLYYLHILYESHFTFSNPYTMEPLVAEGTAMLFDYLEKHGKKLRTDYAKQNEDAIRYLDDTLAPFFQNLPCRFVMFADHGNIVLRQETKLNQVHLNYYTCHEDWIRIPFVIRTGGSTNGVSDQLVSLTNINDIIIALMEGNPVRLPNRLYIKFARSELYNPDFRYLYKMIGEEKRLLAFEGFIFSRGYKLVVYSNGDSELFDLNDNEIVDDTLKLTLLREVVEDITVTDFSNVSEK